MEGSLLPGWGHPPNRGPIFAVVVLGGLYFSATSAQAQDSSVTDVSFPFLSRSANASSEFTWLQQGPMEYEPSLDLREVKGNTSGLTVTVLPDNASLPVGRTLQLFATSEDPDDHEFDWSSSNPAVADVDPLGLVTGVDTGAADIYAVGLSSGDIGSATVSVVSPLAPAIVDFTPKVGSEFEETHVTLTGFNFSGIDEISVAGISVPEFQGLDDFTVIATVQAAPRGTRGPISVKAADQRTETTGEFLFVERGDSDCEAREVGVAFPRDGSLIHVDSTADIDQIPIVFNTDCPTDIEGVIVEFSNGPRTRVTGPLFEAELEIDITDDVRFHLIYVEAYSSTLYFPSTSSFSAMTSSEYDADSDGLPDQPLEVLMAAGDTWYSESIGASSSPERVTAMARISPGSDEGLFGSGNVLPLLSNGPFQARLFWETDCLSLADANDLIVVLEIASPLPALDWDGLESIERRLPQRSLNGWPGIHFSVLQVNDSNDGFLPAPDFTDCPPVLLLDRISSEGNSGITIYHYPITPVRDGEALSFEISPDDEWFAELHDSLSIAGQRAAIRLPRPGIYVATGPRSGVIGCLGAGGAGSRAFNATTDDGLVITLLLLGLLRAGRRYVAKPAP